MELNLVVVSLPATHAHRNGKWLFMDIPMNSKRGLGLPSHFLSQKSDSQNLLPWATARLGKFHSDFFFLEFFWVVKKLWFFNISKCFATPTRADDLFSSVWDHHRLFCQVQFFVSPKLTHCHRSTPHTKVTRQSPVTAEMTWNTWNLALVSLC